MTDPNRVQQSTEQRTRVEKSPPATFKHHKRRGFHCSATEDQHVFHLVFLLLVLTCRALLSIALLSSSGASPLPSIQGLDENPGGSTAHVCRPSLPRADGFERTIDPVLLHFFIAVGAREPGASSDVRDRLLSVSEKCLLQRAWWQPSLPVPVPASSSEGSMQSCWGQPGPLLPPPLLLWLLCFLRVAELRPLCGGCSRSAVGCSLGGNATAGTGRRTGTGRCRCRGGHTPKPSPSSGAACRLPSELPVAKDESLCDGCCTKRMITEFLKS